MISHHAENCNVQNEIFNVSKFPLGKKCPDPVAYDFYRLVNRLRARKIRRRVLINHREHIRVVTADRVDRQDEILQTLGVGRFELILIL